MGFRHIAAIVVSLVVFFILVVSLLVGEYPPPEVFAPFILVVLIVSGTISLYYLRNQRNQISPTRQSDERRYYTY